MTAASAAQNVIVLIGSVRVVDVLNVLSNELLNVESIVFVLASVVGGNYNMEFIEYD